MRSTGRRLAAASGVLRDATWTTTLSGKADLVIASYSLGEMPSAASSLWTSANDVLLVVEPGTPAGYRTVVDARRIAIERGGFVAAPCPHDNECPLRDPDWCHFSQRLPRSSLHRSLKDATLPWEDEKFSYAAVSKIVPSRPSGRVIGRPRYGKNIVRLPLCATAGIVQRLVPRSDPSYRKARKMTWGDAVAD
jgi:ribosomal protein RSM22 (predicted rRNA methylase)